MNLATHSQVVSYRKSLKRFLITLVPFIFAYPINPAYASPIEGQIGFIGIPPYSQGIEAKIKPFSIPFKMGLQAEYLWDPHSGNWAPFNLIDHTTQQWSLWCEGENPLSSCSSLGVLAGFRYSWFSSGSKTQPSNSYNEPRIAPILGFSYTVKKDSFTFRIAPNYLFTTTGKAPLLDQMAVVFESIFNSGIPWFEIDYAGYGGLELALRTAVTPVAVSFKF